MSKRASSKLDPRFEYPDPTPVEVPVSFRRPPSQYDEIKNMIRTAMSDYSESLGSETFEEADDFEMDFEDPDFVSEYEFEELVPESHEVLGDDPPSSLSSQAEGDTPRQVPASAAPVTSKPSAGEDVQPAQGD